MAAECTYPPSLPQPCLCPQGNEHSWKAPGKHTREVTLDPGASIKIEGLPADPSAEIRPSRHWDHPHPIWMTNISFPAGQVETYTRAVVTMGDLAMDQKFVAATAEADRGIPGR
jgi:hypothetical protein